MWDMLKQFVYDMIHMTEGEKLIYYWPLWLIVIVVCFGILHWPGRGKKGAGDGSQK